MKKKNLLIVGLAVLAATTNITLAQNTQPRRQTGGAGDNFTADNVTIDNRTGNAVVQKGNTVFVERLATTVKRVNPTSRTLVIPKDAADAKNNAEVEEDLNVMARILDKAVSSDDKTPRAMGIAVSSGFTGPTAAPQNLYLEGYGAIFFMGVNYPLLAPPAVKESDANAKDKTSNEWEEARREITQPRSTGGGSFGGGGSFQGGAGGGSGGFAWAGGTPVEYDVNKVEELKKDLISALKNAAYIRKLKSDDTVTVVVNGPGTPAGLAPKKPVPPVMGEAESELLGQAFAERARAMVTGPSAKLILRARKSDAESFQKGNLSYDDFRKKVSVILY